MTELEAIELRHSVRSYKNVKIEKEKIDELNKLIDECNKEGDLHLQLLEDAGDTFNRTLSKLMGLASAPSVIACVGKDDETLDERVGYFGEKIVLKAQMLGLNTCWAGTYAPKNVKAEIKDGERLVIVIALGYGENSGRARKSKTVNEVIEGAVNDKPEWFIKGVESALKAPTAINQQKFIFSLNEEEAIIKDKKGVLSKVDIGIVRYHFEVVSNHKSKFIL